MKRALVGLFLWAGVSAYAQDLGQWGTASIDSYKKCSFQMGAAMMWGSDAEYEKTRTCVAEETSARRQEFGSLPQSDRLKDYFATWSAGMNALRSMQYGSRRVAEEKNRETRQRLEEMWTRIELDAK